MAKTIEQVRSICSDLSLDEIKTRVDNLEGNPEGESARNLYQQVLNELKLSEDNKPLDLIIGEYWVKLRTSAHRRDKEFNLTFSDVKKLCLKTHCEYTGAELNRANRTTDRFNPNMGYVKGNVFAVTNKANSAKNLLLEQRNSQCYLGFDGLKKMISVIDNMRWE